MNEVTVKEHQKGDGDQSSSRADELSLDSLQAKSSQTEHGYEDSKAKVSQSVIPQIYRVRGQQALSSIGKQIDILMTEKKWPKIGWTDMCIEILLNQLAAQDSNNFISKSGIGEREGRIFSDLVSKRHYRLSHGIGRSGSLTESQPKAIGSSILADLANSLVLDLCRVTVSKDVAGAFISPMATGMSISLVLLTLKRKYPDAKYVIWPRIDQKSCFKSMSSIGLTPVPVQGVIENGSEIRTNLEEVQSKIDLYGARSILCILSTTSCFAPRVCDSVVELAKICAQNQIPHVINNAYGLQAYFCNELIRKAHRVGRVDYFVQSTDKNLMVPVGGAIIAGYDKSAVEDVGRTYAGRASSSQSMDVLITLLAMGQSGYQTLQSKREDMFGYLSLELEKLGLRYGERIIKSTGNPISIGLTLRNVGESLQDGPRAKYLTQLGSMLFTRNVFGARVVTCKESNTLDGHVFRGWGAHHDSYPVPYLTAAAGIGIEKSDVDTFIKKLDESLCDLNKILKKATTGEVV